MSAWSSRSAAEPEFEVEGTIDYRIAGEAGTDVVRRLDSFCVSVKGCAWHIKKIPALFVKGGVQQDRLPQSFVAATDSTNFFYLVSHPTNRIGVAGRRPQSNATGLIGNGAVPYAVSDVTIIWLWYAFASHCYLSEVDEPYLVPPLTLTDVSDYARDYRVSATWERSANAPRLPSSLVFGNRCRFQTNLTEDFTNAVYHVSAFTNTRQFVIPSQADVQYFRCVLNSDGTVSSPVTTVPAASISITVTNVREKVSLPSFAVDIEGTALLSDLRPLSTTLPHPVPVGLATNWPDPDHSRRTAEYLLRAEVHLGERRERTRYVFTLLFIIIAAAIPIAIFVRTKRVPRNPTEKGS
jgi:hypothetical protein